MLRTVVAGLDGSPESRAATEWAAREARLRGLPLKIVHVWEPVPEPMAQAPLLGAETQQHWTERVPREAAEAIRLRHPDMELTVEQRTGDAAGTLLDAAEDADLLVLGSRGLGGLGGFMVGSVGLAVVARAERPVVLVRAGEQAADEHEPDAEGLPSTETAYRPVVLGLDATSPDETLIRFAFEEAARRGTTLRVLHGWNLPPYYVYGLSVDIELHDEIVRQQAVLLADVLKPWRQKFPDVEVVEEVPAGSPGARLVDVSREASLMVVGRRMRRRPFGAHIGPVTHAVLHHAAAPVAVVPHH
ncbi:universal stress protein [Streptomyces sp. NPDC057412]|uniref:universal stress protein n=1 Tax=Streptomyces sp. NPDC057412 TaxID=3346123 RepID=UPI0036980C13